MKANELYFQLKEKSNREKFKEVRKKENNISMKINQWNRAESNKNGEDKGQKLLLRKD